MALIGSIRKRTGLLIAIIAVAMLAFLLMDGLSSKSRMGAAGAKSIGKIAGKKLDIQEFDRMYNHYEERYETFNSSFNSDESGRAEVRDIVWNEMITNALLSKNYKDLGISVNLKELENAMYGDKIHPIAKSILANPETRQFDPKFAYDIIKSVEDGTNTRENDIKIINHLKEMVNDELIKEKYAALYNVGDFVPDFLAKQSKKITASNADFSYVYFPYSDIPDTEVTVSDKELQNYLTANSALYKKEASREVWLYKINLIPSSKDSLDAKEELTKLLEEFKVATNDSLFVRKYSEIKYDVVYQKREELESNPNVESFFVDEKGTFYEPYFENGANVITKLVDRKAIPDSVRASHILLPQPKSVQERDSLQLLADSLIELINGGVDFATLAAKYSTDGSNNQKGGDLDYFTTEVMAKPFNDACFYVYKKGDVFQVITQYGLHIVKITEATPTSTAVRLANVSRTLAYSKNTAKELLNEMNEFRLAHDTPEKFEAAEKAKDYSVTKLTLTQNQVLIPQLGQVREIVRWAFKEKIGTIVDFDLNDQYILAYIKSATEKGVQPLSAVKGEITQKVLNEKKAEKIIATIAEASDLQSIASKTGKEVVANNIVRPSFPRINGVDEFEVVGKLFGLKPGSVSKPIKGENGIYVVQLASITEPAADENLMIEKNNLKIPFEITSAINELKEKAAVKDLRYQFY